MTIDPTFWTIFWPVFWGALAGGLLGLFIGNVSERSYNEIVFRRNRNKWEHESDTTRD